MYHIPKNNKKDCMSRGRWLAYSAAGELIGLGALCQVHRAVCGAGRAERWSRCWFGMGGRGGVCVCVFFFFFFLQFFIISGFFSQFSRLKRVVVDSWLSLPLWVRLVVFLVAQQPWGLCCHGRRRGRVCQWRSCEEQTQCVSALSPPTGNCKKSVKEPKSFLSALVSTCRYLPMQFIWLCAVHGPAKRYWAWSRSGSLLLRRSRQESMMDARLEGGRGLSFRGQEPCSSQKAATAGNFDVPWLICSSSYTTMVTTYNWSICGFWPFRVYDLCGMPFLPLIPAWFCLQTLCVMRDASFGSGSKPKATFWDRCPCFCSLFWRAYCVSTTLPDLTH